ncbi:MAG: hypothetical protein MUC61_03395 [Amoebophilaceae bacterium]|nr:hypothetical protein [Amoebophilaceae bacterium]
MTDDTEYSKNTGRGKLPEMIAKTWIAVARALQDYTPYGLHDSLLASYTANTAAQKNID